MSTVIARSVSRPGYATESVVWAWQAVASALGLVLALPLLLVIAAAIKLSSPGPVLYRGDRVGLDGRVFTIFKFRTMVTGAETQIGARLFRGEDRARYLTPIGTLLKRAKLDELPQLINVVRGEMRLVGPRPIRPVFLAPFLSTMPAFRRRLTVPPGLTGIAQLRGGYYTPPRNKLRYDLLYVSRRSALLDLKLIVLTFVKILERWLGTGLLVMALVVMVSLLPAHHLPWDGLGLAAGRLDLVQLGLIGGAAVAFLRAGPTRFSLYRCPLNAPMLVFAGLAGLAWATSGEAPLGVTGTAVLAGGLLAFLIVNTLASPAVFTVTARVIALTSALVSLLSLLSVFAVNYVVAPDAGPLLGDPAALAVYLLLGVPLLFAEVKQATTRRARDLWLVLATISCVGVVFTRTAIGLTGLAVTLLVFLLPRPRAVATALAILSILVVLPDALEGPGAAVRAAAVDGLDTPALRATLLGRTLAADAAPSAFAAELTAEPPRPRRAGAASSHHAVLYDSGVLGWAAVLWLLVSVLRTLERARGRARDARTRATLHAVSAALAGFAVAMLGADTFPSLPIQVFVWSLIGLGLGIAVRLEGRRRNVIWRFGDAGD